MCNSFLIRSKPKSEVFSTDGSFFTPVEGPAGIRPPETSGHVTLVSACCRRTIKCFGAVFKLSYVVLVLAGYGVEDVFVSLQNNQL